jgi:hypothetical protein
MPSAPAVAKSIDPSPTPGNKFALPFEAIFSAIFASPVVSVPIP